MGRIPIYLWDDSEWLPYKDTNISVTEFGFSGQMRHLGDVGNAVHKLLQDKATIKKFLDKVHAVRYYYTYEGVLDQIDQFLSDPFGPQGGYFRCVQLPHTDHRKR